MGVRLYTTSPTFSSSSPTKSTENMNIFKRFSSQKAQKRDNNPFSSTMSNTRSLASQGLNPMAQQQDAPPAYSAGPQAYTASSQAYYDAPQQLAAPADVVDSPYAFLRQFDTVFIIDDSGSMSGRNWRETEDALAAITPICTEQDADGVDVYFLNHRNRGHSLGGYTQLTTTAAVRELFQTVKPRGSTPTGTRLNDILKQYVAGLPSAIKKQERGQETDVKPLNIIVITDGAASDDVESAIVSAAKKLDKMGAEPWQIGVQFFQVGRDPEAAKDLRQLDDALSDQHGVRDMVDTVPWNGMDGAALTADGIMKVTMGAINRKLDRKKASDLR